MLSFVGGLMFGFLSLFGIQALVSSRRLLAFRLAWQQLNRKKRQAALLMAGLMIGSAIVSSSLIVGDSLDQTVREEVDAAWGDTDVFISGFDTNLGQVTEIPQSRVADIRGANLEVLDSIQAGRFLSTSVVTPDGKADPSVAWFALEHNEGSVIGTAEEGLSWFELEEINRFSTTPQVVVNQVFSDELEVGVGDEIQLGWFVRNQNGVERIEENFTIHQVVAMAGQGQLAGTTSPALFTDLLSAQEWQQSEGNVTSIRISLDGVEEKRSAVTPVLDEIARTLNASIGVSESGLQLIAESNAVTVASTNGLGRLSPRIVQSLFENKTSLMQEAMMLEVLQVPLVGLDSSSSNLLTLADGDLNGVMHEDGTLWHWGPAGFGYESNNTSWVWRVPGGEIINDVSIDGGLGFAAFDDGLVLGNASDDDATDYIIEEREMVAVASNSTSWYAIEGGESASLWFGNLGDGSAEHTPLSIDLPSQLGFDGGRGEPVPSYRGYSE